MTNNTIYTITLEKAADWAFTIDVQSVTFNCLALPRIPKVETLVRYNRGGGKNKWTTEFQLEAYPFTTTFSGTDQHSGDLDALITFLEDDLPLRIKESTLPRYDDGGAEEIPTRSAFIENCPVFVTGFEVSLDKEQGEETLTMTLEKVIV